MDEIKLRLDSISVRPMTPQFRASKTGTQRPQRSAWRADASAYNESLGLLGNNNAEAFRLNEIAAENGMHDAVLAMGWFYLNGYGVKPNVGEAVRWFKKSARQGDTSAMFSLGQIAYTDREFEEALIWFERAAKKGHHRSSFWIGKMYWRGEGVAKDRKTAQALFQDATAHKVYEATRTMRFLSFLASRPDATRL